MVVPADSTSTLAGLTENGISDMPLDTFEPMPDGDDDAALSDEFDTEDVPTDPVDDSGDPTEALRAEIVAAETARIQAELATKFDTDRANLQRVKDREIAAHRQQAMAAQAREQAFREQYIAQMREYGVEDGEIQRHLDAIEGRQSRAEKAVSQQVQQVQAGFQQTAASLIARHDQRLKEMAFKGDQQLFDPKDPEIQNAFMAALGYAKQHYDIDGGKPGSRYEQQAQAAFEGVKELLRIKREQGLESGTVLQRQAAAQKQAAQRAKAKARGPQNLATGGGASASNDDQLMQAIRAEVQAEGFDPNSHYADKVFPEYMRRKMAAQGA